MRKKRLAYNTISSLVYQIVAIICGFILPRLILKVYDSEVNGLVNSIAQFFQVIAVLDLGVGTVVKSALYKPLAEKNETKISKILSSARKFFNKIAKVLCVYVLFLPFLFAFSVSQSFDFLFTTTLIFSMSISSFAQYYFGMVNQLLLNADQKGYVQYNLQTITLILNTLICSILILLGASIQLIKLTTSIIFLFRPLYLKWYVNKHYNVDYSISYKKEPIKQKWNGISQHLAAVVLDSTDTIILSLFSTLSNVSIYSVYFLVIHGLRQLMQALVNGLQSLFGSLLANHEGKKLFFAFEFAEWGIHTLTTFLFGCTCVLIVPFVQVYTKGVTDANYIAPLFAFLITLAHASFCLRLPYHLLVTAGGHYRETQHNYLIAVFINIILSVLSVKFLGLVGVAIGTLVAMLYQTIWMAHYCSENLICCSFKYFLKQMFVNILTLSLGICSTIYLPFKNVSYVSWLILALETVIIWIIIVLIVNFIFYKEKFISVASKMDLFHRH